jgi:sporulation protein YlmC with PRC-barrel domain
MEEFTLGARASCPDGFCGVVRGTIVDPAARTVTHEFGRLDPAEKVVGDTWPGGQIGQVEGFMVNPADEKVTHILLEEGHLWGRKQVAIPVGAVASIEDGIRLNITKRQVEDLPPLGQFG